MRKVMDIVFAEGNRLGIPVVLDTDYVFFCSTCCRVAISRWKLFFQ